MKPTTTAAAATNTRLIVFHTPHFPKPSSTISPSYHRLYLILILSLLSFFTLSFSLLKPHSTSPSSPSSSPSSSSPTLPISVSSTLLHYTSLSSNSSMSRPEMDLVASTIIQCQSTPCNVLVFGLTHQTHLWKSLNFAGRTVFLDESEYRISALEKELSRRDEVVEAYDVQYTTTVGKLDELVRMAREKRKDECRPVQNLLFSECGVGINDLPNHLYVIPWDVILIDGPRGYDKEMPGRMSAIFTAGVLARSKRGGGRDVTDVFVHDFGREVERVCGEEFLCEENLVEVTENLAHYVVERMEPDSVEFCRMKKKKSDRKVTNGIGRKSKSSSNKGSLPYLSTDRMSSK